MEDKLKEFFNENNFDIYEPHSGHSNRFQRKLQQQKKQHKPTIFWMSIAASIVLVLGFYLGSYQQNNNYDLADISPKMAETQSFFVSTINQELKEIEQYRNIETEKIIEDSLEKIEELEDHYKALISELTKNENKRQVIQKMIGNYQQRLTVLERLLLQLERQKNPTKLEILDDEII
ncbi:hypothetical protein CXF68_11130 [Tenacibaculum sp. Bg11-29]|uniref:hypothetical protein n=1 Tax=Tenacibaculum sp. Bg11-29 TaxID=2058306 RepID=UPI000C32F17E|nr:hypothetical protein [Tenacibaculum sp. Bg11-29]PKH51200.1 hypothetical protein CXF68_11130 [Tenacibaculum sp. Bg11-29]